MARQERLRVPDHFTRSKYLTTGIRATRKDSDTYDEARLRRDPVHEVVFFMAERTAAIYCRHVCSAKHPLTKNVSSNPSAGTAERAATGAAFIAALFCPAWKGTKTMLERALQMIETGALHHGTVEALAAGTVITIRPSNWRPTLPETSGSVEAVRRRKQQPLE
ncbi:Ada metal-binding domain-containing protein [Agrobacterium tumefaciens]|uniref:Ada metal-binding domain-containing protein n=1 Tax=Agrobacterium tumefaciens TaxID=358 RepID=UPI000EF1BA31|nr:Ada metal-binding domain-containing protein [Agrobacterium tumefaciens]NSZ35554.1 hypothetical protein [Agrobacterium tumefaciens]QLG25249.1 hypothetical protein EML4_23240 [Agrobacterium tumefaciens]UXS87463.1 hypothetical protein FY144_14285 [Agrobacterium tumefaciens]